MGFFKKLLGLGPKTSSRMMAQQDRDTILRQLHRSIHQQWHPKYANRIVPLLDYVAYRIVALLDLNRSERDTLNECGPWWRGDFLRAPNDMDFVSPFDWGDWRRQLSVAQELFGRKVPDDVRQIEAWVKGAEQTIGKTFGRNDFKQDRLPKGERKKAGIDISRRQYNKRFRLAVRLENKARRLENYQRSLTLASRFRLASHITWEDFSSDLNTASFIAYYAAGHNAAFYDRGCVALMHRCRARPDVTNWWAIAHVLPTKEVISHLDDEQKGVLLAAYFDLMHETAQFLKELWETNEVNEDMWVRKGSDCTAWNVTAGAWNRQRDDWFSLMYALGMLDAVEQMCPAKCCDRGTTFTKIRPSGKNFLPLGKWFPAMRSARSLSCIVCVPNMDSIRWNQGGLRRSPAEASRSLPPRPTWCMGSSWPHLCLLWYFARLVFFQGRK